jgi:RNA polymerase sigma factor (TIGR02999 family)
MQSTGSITQFLERWEAGSPHALNHVVEQAYEKLAQQARGMMRGERRGHTLQTRALVHETYIRLLEIRNIDWQNRGHFYAVAASIMRRVLVDHARAKQSQKRGSDSIHVSLEKCEPVATDSSVPAMLDVVALNDAMISLEKQDPTQAQVVELRYFGGLTIAETADALNLSPATVKRKWAVAQTWLYRELSVNQ